MFHSIITALITPFKNNKIDEYSLEKIIKKQIDAGVSALLIIGTTGEGATLSYEEKLLLIELVVKIADKKIKIIAGTGNNDTNSSILLSQKAQMLGADALCLITPYYNRPGQRGIYEHFKLIHDNSNLPIMLYSVPKRTGIDFTDETIVDLANLPRIEAFKDASGDIERPIRIINKIGNRVKLLSGNDSEAIAFNAAGGVGCVSVASNIFPKLLCKIQNLWFKGEFQEAISLQNYAWPLFNALFLEVNPICVKYAAYLMGLCQNEIRMPLTTPNSDNIKVLMNVIEKYGLYD